MNIIDKPGRPARLIRNGLAALAAVAALGAHAAPLLDISQTPLFGSQIPHPNIAVTLSVEYPTVGVAFTDGTYYPANDYVGYFDLQRCYTYVTGTPGHFVNSAAAVLPNHTCTNQFSGNFMNWLTMSAIDEFRYAMTGGNRADSSDLAGTSGAILERAFLPDGALPSPASFYDSGNYPPRSMAAADLVSVVPTTVAGTGTVVMHNCQSKVFFGVGGGNCGSPDAVFGAFDVRVAVCGATELPARPDLCKNYGTSTSPIWKPVGEAQRNAGSARFAAFGYLMDRNAPIPGCLFAGWNRCRYGGVLRAPMHYLGPTDYDANLVPSSNAQREINADGTLRKDPYGTAVVAGGYSGFINYINKFGATGVYKSYDPMGEIYYEAIRYYQNLPATPEAYDPAPSSTLSLDTLDNFPITTAWSDPILARCARNFVVNLSDTNTWDDKYIPGYVGSPGSSGLRPASRPIEGGLDAYLWTTKIGQLEADPSTTTITAGDHVPALYGLQDASTGADAAYLAAGVAYWANTNDIRSTLPGKQTVQTFNIDVNEASGVPFNQRALFLMGKYGGFSNSKDRVIDGTQENPFWGVDPLTDSTGPAIRTNSEWESPPGSALPAGYLLASSPQRMIDGLRAAFANFIQPIGTANGFALTSSNLFLSGAGAYVAKFTPNTWTGTVERHDVSVNASYEAVVSPLPSPISWDAGNKLDARCGSILSALTTCEDTSTAVDNRSIFTAIPSGIPGGRTAVDFTWAGISPDLTYTAALSTPNPAFPLSLDTHGHGRLNFIRGYRHNEGLYYRNRDSVLGDIINSAPTYVGAPSTNIPDDDYQAFYGLNSGRRTAVYVGANDGMLHAFDGSANANGGTELFAYVPGYSKTDLSSLSSMSYTHKIYVDTTPKVQEVKLGSSPGVWKTVLVGASGNGAQGVFALDVTNPLSFGTSNVLFEFSDADDPDFGSVLSAPEIAKLQVGVDVSNNAIYKYFAVVTGYNPARTMVNGRTDNSVSSDGTKGYLFLLALDHPIGTSWGTPNVAGAQYYKYAFPAFDATKPMGLAPVALVPSKTGDRSTSAMYFGDLQGNVWRFNTQMNGSPYTPANWWKPALGTVTVPQPIFTAAIGANRQPITERIEVGNGPFGSNILFFGTGQYLGDSDQTPAGTMPFYSQQSEYTLLDTNPSTSSTLTRADLAVRNATLNMAGDAVAISGSPFTYSGPTAKRGWYLDFPSSASVGERSINKPAVRTGLLTFDTLTLASDICGTGGGFIYQVDALTGLQVSGLMGGYASTVGIPGPPQIVDLQSILGTNRATGEQINQRKQTTMVAGVKGTIDTTRDSSGNAVAVVGKVPPIGRVNWREITNWNDKTKH